VDILLRSSGGAHADSNVASDGKTTASTTKYHISAWLMRSFTAALDNKATQKQNLTNYKS